MPKQKKKYYPSLHNTLRRLIESTRTPHLMENTNTTATNLKCSVSRFTMTASVENHKPLSTRQKA